MLKLKCEICSLNQQTDLLTRCCKLFICAQCKQKYEKTGTCICGKPVAKRLCTPNPQLFQLIANYYQDKDQQCDRCDQSAEYECKNCCMLFCGRCNAEVHNGRGFAKHKRQPYTKASSSNTLGEKAKKKQQWCKEHKQANEAICECGMQLCGICVKTHKEVCTKTAKTKSLKQYKEQYFSQIFYKIRQITQYKQRLLEEKKNYRDHQVKQKQVFDSYSKLMEQQLEGLKKILQVKITQIHNRMSEYWRECENVYKKNCYVIDYYLKKYDDYGRLTEKFMEKMVGLDYLERRVKRVYVTYDFFNFKVLGVDDIQNSIVGLTSTSKEWELRHENILLGFEAQDEKVPILRDKKVDLLGNLAGNSEFLLQCSQNPLNHRPLTLKASHQQIQFQFLHLPYQDQTSYEIEYGIGLKNKGQEIFKRITNNNGIGVLEYLNPSTKYRVRMRVTGGQWGPITEIKTQQSPKLLAEGGLATKNYSDSSVQFLKPGVVYGTNEINFGTHEWQLKIFPGKHNEEDTACISVGVSNKQQKKPIFVGSTLNYGYHKTVITVKVSLNCQENRLTILSSTGTQEQIFQNLPYYPIYPAVQNKGSGPVQIQCTFL